MGQSLPHKKIDVIGQEESSIIEEMRCCEESSGSGLAMTEMREGRKTAASESIVARNRGDDRNARTKQHQIPSF